MKEGENKGVRVERVTEDHLLRDGRADWSWEGLLNDLGVAVGKEYLLVATEVEPTWPVVVQYRPWLRVSKPQTFIACGQCGADFGFATSPVPTRCHSCQAKLVGSIPQSEVAALLRREGGAA